MERKQFALDVYMSRMFKIIMYFVPLLALGAGINFTVLKAMGYYTSVSWPLLIVFDVTNILYCGLGVLFANVCEDKDKNLKPKIVYLGKLVISLVIIIQWNYISYMIPSRNFWAFFVLFIFVAVFFLDSKYVLHTVGIVVVSMVISWIVKPNELLPVRDEFFVPEIILRCILIFFVCTLMFLMTFIVEKLLVKELEKIAEYDPLTLLRNRRTLNIYIDRAIEEYKKNNKQFCFLMADIDDFKIVNDTYGHPFGDVVLKNIGKIFILGMGEECRLFRYGGEEVCAIIPCEIDKAEEMAEKVRKEIELSVHTQDDISVQVTMSMGIVQFKKGMDKDSLIKISDGNLYYAKNHGKNKIII